jgi:hypothetical protein
MGLIAAETVISLFFGEHLLGALASLLKRSAK